MTKSLQNIMQFCLSKPWAALLLFAACGSSLVSAAILEHFFDVFPCDLCIKQRIPFALVMALIIPACSSLLPPKAYRWIFRICALILFANVGLAFFHSGVELHWWGGTSGCGVNPAVFANDPEVMRKMLLNTPVVRCDEINFTILGMTLANINVLWSLVLGCFAGFVGILRK